MNQFSLKRTGLLIKKQWVENRRLYTMSAFALTGVLGIVFGLWLAMSGSRYEESSPYIFGLVGLFITGAIFASTTYSMLNAKDTGIYWISFPASHFEKLLVTLFYNVIVFTTVYVVIFFILKWISEAYIGYLIENGEKLYSYRKVDWFRNEEFTKAFPVFCYAFFGLQAVYILGSASFKKFSFIITTVLVAAFLFCFVYYISKIATRGFPDYNFHLFSLTERQIREEETYKEYLMQPLLKDSILFFLKFLITPFLWLITWFKLKEKQI